MCVLGNGNFLLDRVKRQAQILLPLARLLDLQDADWKPKVPKKAKDGRHVLVAFAEG